MNAHAQIDPAGSAQATRPRFIDVLNELNPDDQTKLQVAARRLAKKICDGKMTMDDAKHNLEQASDMSQSSEEIMQRFWPDDDQEPQPDYVDYWPEEEQEAETKPQIFALKATPFTWTDPASIPPRQWVYGHHLIRKQISVTVAPGGAGKSSNAITEALAMVTGCNLLGDHVPKPVTVWYYNLEDEGDEQARRFAGAMQHNNIKPDDIDGRVYLDTGREQPLCTAIQTRDGAKIQKPVMDALAAEIEARGIDVLIVDPFVSSHQVNENDNGAIDLVTKEWARLADRCNCAIELIHHTRKTNGEEATTESGRGASAMMATARSGRVLNKMTEAERAKAGVEDDPATYFAVTRDKANLAPIGKRVWRRIASVQLANGDGVGVVEAWQWPDAFDGMTVDHLKRVQQAIEGKKLPHWPLAADWIGYSIAEILGLDTDNEADKETVKACLKAWIKSGALKVETTVNSSRNRVKIVEVGEWV